MQPTTIAAWRRYWCYCTHRAGGEGEQQTVEHLTPWPALVLLLLLLLFVAFVYCTC
jgi:hypothetical protein